MGDSDYCFSRIVCPSVRPSVCLSTLLKISPNNTTFKREKWLLLAGLWVWPSGSIMAHMSCLDCLGKSWLRNDNPYFLSQIQMIFWLSILRIFSSYSLEKRLDNVNNIFLVYSWLICFFLCTFSLHFLFSCVSSSRYITRICYNV